MPHVTADRVRETSTTTGTGAYTLAGAAPGFRSFGAVMATGDTAFYAASDQANAGWEVGVGTMQAGGTLARTAILSSSNGGAEVNWGAGTRDIFITIPARSSTVDIQEFGSPTTSGTSTWTKPAGARLVHVLVFAGGSGGGSGRRRGGANIATQAAFGGGGGGAGGRFEMWFSAAALSDTETVIVGAGGTGGPAQTADGTDGNAGAAGGDSSFGTVAVARGSRNIANASAPPQGGWPGNAFGSSNNPGGGGGMESVANGASNYSAVGGLTSGSIGSPGGRGGLRGGGGASGSGFVANSTTARAGEAGGAGGSALLTSGQSSGGGGAAGTDTGGNGGNGANAAQFFVGGDGGGSGGCTDTVAGSGGNGGWPGGGGGGGAAASGSFNSGAGGNGANGYVRITTYF